MFQFLSKINKFICIAFVLCLSSCRLFHAETNIQIRVVNAAGEPIPDAKISLQKQHYATTNSEGMASIQADLPINETILVEVTKSSDLLFYAPFFENIQVKRGESNSFKLRATLFAVPKGISKSNKAPDTLSDSNSAPGSDQVQPTSESINNEATFNLAPASTETGLTSDASHIANPIPSDNESQIEIAPSSSNESRLLTLYAESNAQPIANASFLYGDPERLQWLEACTSNARGRCAFSLPHSFPYESISILVRASGFVTQTQTLPLAQGDRFRFDLPRGNSLDVFTLLRRYQTITGLEGVKILLGDKEIGQTDRFGFFSQTLPISPKENQTIRLLSLSHHPSESRFPVTPGTSSTLIQNFQQNLAPNPRVFLLPISQSGSQIGPNQLTREEKLIRGLRQHLLNQSPFEEADFERVGPLLSKLDLSPKQLAKKGWDQTELVNEMEYALRAFITESPRPTLELSLLDSQAKVIAASKAALPDKIELATLRPILRRLSQELALQVPFEGSIIESINEGFAVNLGLQKGHAISSGGVLRLYGNLPEAGNQKHNWTEIGTAKIIEVGEEKSKIRIDELKPKATAAVGQLIKVQRSSTKPSSFFLLEVKDKLDKYALTQANIYLNNQWIGSTDQRGIAQIDGDLLKKRSFLTLLKPGYRPYGEDFIPDGKSKLLIPMQRDNLTIRIESIPDQALVKLNGRLLGRSPLYQTVEAIDAEATLEVEHEDYRSYQTLIKFDEDGIDFTGEKSIKLIKDPRREARQLIDQGRLQEAIDLLENLPTTHPDILLATHELGEIYLNRVNDPVKAAATFQRVTSNAEIANFDDKRFIGTHINHAVALYHSGEKLHANDPEMALANWQQAVDRLNKTEGQLRFVPQNQYTQALHSLYYYRAICLQRSWALTQNPDFLRLANEAWKSYIQSTALSTPADRNYALLKKAETFFKQTQTLLQGSLETASKSYDNNPKRAL